MEVRSAGPRSADAGSSGQSRDLKSQTKPPKPQAKPPLKPAYLIVGDDLPKVERALRRLKARIVEESGTDLNIDEFDAALHSAGEVVNAANTLAFLGGIRLVLVQQVQRWPKTDKDLVAVYLESPAPDACLALVADKLAPTDPLRKAMEKHGMVLEYQAPKESQLPQWLADEAAQRGLKLGLAEARLMVQRCGDNQNILLRELEKVQAYAGGEPVTADAILEVTVPTVEASNFDLLDALALKRGAVAFAAADELLASGERVESLFYRILRHFQNLSRVAALRAEGLGSDAIQAELKLKPYALKKMLEQATRLGPEGIARCLAVLAETDVRLKGQGTLPEELELELCLGRLLNA
ncbi:MAG: DNA polymerase III subunit delta [Thermoleophilia bacterium]|nr:DNA polymerase III subunit delta [Thermoleophilia bacterium]